MVMPDVPHWVVHVRDGYHLPHIDLNLDDHSALLRVANRIVTGFLKTCTKVDSRTKHPIFEFTETARIALALLGGAMIHDVSLVVSQVWGK